MLSNFLGGWYATYRWCKPSPTVVKEWLASAPTFRRARNLSRSFDFRVFLVFYFFRYFARKKAPGQIELRVKNARFIGELVKFRVSGALFCSISSFGIWCLTKKQQSVVFEVLTREGKERNSLWSFEGYERFFFFYFCLLCTRLFFFLCSFSLLLSLFGVRNMQTSSLVVPVDH